MRIIGIDAVAQCDASHGGTRLQAFLDDLGFERLGIRGSLAHDDPLVAAKNGVHIIALCVGITKVCLADAYFFCDT